jgi:hypothetical protein
MKNKELIEIVLNNLENYEITIHYNTNHTNIRLEFNAIEETYRSFKITNLIDLDTLIFDDTEIKINDIHQYWELNNYIKSNEHINHFLNEFKKYDDLQKYFKEYNCTKTYNQIDEKYILIINDNVVQSIIHSDSKVAFYCGDNQIIYSYNIIKDPHGNKWFHKDGDEILIFTKESSLF